MSISDDAALLVSAAERAAGCAAPGAGDTGLGSTRRRFAAGAILSAGTPASSFASNSSPGLVIRAKVQIRELHAARVNRIGTVRAHEHISSGVRAVAKLAQIIVARGPRLSPKELVYVVLLLKVRLKKNGGALLSCQRAVASQPCLENSCFRF